LVVVADDGHVGRLFELGVHVHGVLDMGREYFGLAEFELHEVFFDLSEKEYLVIDNPRDESDSVPPSQ